MGIVELLAAIGDERIKFQNLDDCTIQAHWGHKTGTKITFGTEERLGPDGTKALGLVVWLPREEVERILAFPAPSAPEESPSSVPRCLVCHHDLALHQTLDEHDDLVPCECLGCGCLAQEEPRATSNGYPL